MDLGKQIRLGRLFSHPSGRLCSLAVDHFVGYNKGLPVGLRNVPETLRGRKCTGSIAVHTLRSRRTDPRFCCAANVVTASEAREPDVYRDCSNRLLDGLDSYSKCNKPPDRTPQRS